MKWSFITSGNYINFIHTDETSLRIQSTIHRLHNTSKCIDWSLPADTRRITFTIDEDKYENILLSDIDFDGSVCTTAAGFITSIKAMFANLGSGPGDGGSSYLVKTYAELVGLINSSGLVAGTQYEISDFATKHYIVDTNRNKPAGNPTVTGVTEPLIVTAISTSEVDKVAKSTLYPQDIIYVDFIEDNWLDDVSFSDSGVIVSGWKGTIYFRHDTLFDNYCGYDFRNCKFRRWKTNAGTWDSGTTYALNDFVTHDSVVYKSIKASNTNHTPSDNSAYWFPLLSLLKTEYWLTSPTDWSNIPASTDFADFKLFAEGSGTATYDFSVRSNHCQSFKDDNTDHDLFGTILNNVVFHLQDNGYFNILSNTFYQETAGMTFADVVYYTVFEKDARLIMLDFTSYCVFSAGANNVIAFGELADIKIGSSCSGIYFGGHVSSVSFGSNSSGIKLGKDSLILNFSNYVSNVTFGNGATMNTISEYFDGQAIDFSAATHIYGTYNCNLFTRQGGGKRLSYFDSSDTLTVVASNA